MMRMVSTVMVLSVAIMACAAGGCKGAPRMGEYTYRVSIDSGLADPGTGFVPSTEVDIIGINDDEVARWEAKGVDEYFSPGDVMRADRVRSNGVYRMTFTNEDHEPEVLPWDDDIWQTWLGQGATHVCIMTSMATPPGTPEGAPDPRKLLLPLSLQRWNNKQIIELVVEPSGLRRITPMKQVRE